MDYFSALELVKDTFLDGSERNIVCDYLIHNFERKPLHLLDVGIGDGRDTGKITSKLNRAGIPIIVTGIDPLPESKKMVGVHSPAFDAVTSRFEDYETTNVYDIVMASQSLYYLDEPYNSIEKMIRFTKRGGVVILVLWSQHCTISRLFRPCTECDTFYAGRDLVTIEQCFRHVQTLEGLHDAQLVYFPARVSLSLWKTIPELVPAACAVFPRVTTRYAPLHEHIQHERMLLDHFNELEQRMNGIIFIQR